MIPTASPATRGGQFTARLIDRLRSLPSAARRDWTDWDLDMLAATGDELTSHLKHMVQVQLRLIHAIDLGEALVANAERS